MKKYIAEDLPARSHPQAQLSSKPQNNKKDSSDSSGAEKTPEQRIRQAVYDIRYRARRENLPIRTAYSQYMQNSSMSEMEKAEVRAKLFGKNGIQSESFDMKSFASSTMANALYRVFVQNESKLAEDYLIELKKSFETPESKKYKIIVSDPESGVSYVRYATRDKMSQLRAMGLKLEMTEYGEPYEGEREKGEKTAEVSRNKASKDYDGDGKIESSSKEHAGSVHNAIQKKRGLPQDGNDTSNVKEEYFDEVLGMVNLPQVDNALPVNSDTNKAIIDVLPPDKKNKVTVNPSNSIMAHNVLTGNLIAENGYKTFLNYLQEKKMSVENKRKEKNLKSKYDKSNMKNKMENQYGGEKGRRIYFATIRKQAMKEANEDSEKKMESNCTDDQRSLPTKMSLVKNKFRAMGLKVS